METFESCTTEKLLCCPSACCSDSKVVGKQRYSCFQANGPGLFSINHQSLQSSRETRPKRLPGTCVGSEQHGARVSGPPAPGPLGRPGQVKAPDGQAPPRCEFKSP